MAQERPELSVIVPAFNEEASLPRLYTRVVAVLERQAIPFELVVVDDGSDDATAATVQQIAAHDPRVVLVRLTRNFGHEAASSCGFDVCRGQAAVLIDADLQDPPEVIPAMIEKWRQGYDIVYGRRTSRQGETRLKRLTSHLFYRYFNRFAGRAIPADVGDFRLVDRKVIDAFNQLPERNRFVRGMFSWLGYNQTVVDFERAPRVAGSTKYNYLKLFWLSWEAVTSFSVAPLRLCMGIGALVTLFALAMAVWIVVQKLFLSIPIPGYALATAGMFLLGGVQLMFLGVIGEYIGKIYTQVQGRPIYLTREDAPPKGDALKPDPLAPIPQRNENCTD